MAMDRFRRVLGELRLAGARAWVVYQETPEIIAGLAELLPVEVADRSGRRDLAYGLRALCRGEESVILTGIGADGGDPFWRQVVALTTRFRVSRLVLPHQAGGMLDQQGRVMSYVNHRFLARLAADQHTILGWIRALLLGGVAEVSLCRLAEVDQELFTYQGSGTFFSWRHYCRVRPLVLNDFPRVEAVIRRGEREGYLLRRTDAELADILFSGYGAFIGGDHLAGVCGLLHEPYQEAKAGEIVSLYAMTRFKGEGVGVQLVARARRDARRLGLRFLFACTRRPGVVDFFCRNGFQPVAHERVPSTKWQGYDARRKADVIAVRLDLGT